MLCSTLCSLPRPPHPESQSGYRRRPCSGGKPCLQWRSLEQPDLFFTTLLLSRGILRDWGRGQVATVTLSRSEEYPVVICADSASPGQDVMSPHEGSLTRAEAHIPF